MLIIPQPEPSWLFLVRVVSNHDWPICFLHIFLTVDWAQFPRVFLNRLRFAALPVFSVCVGWLAAGREVADVPPPAPVLRILYNMHSNR